jgi:hypothetical protein
MQTSYMTPNLAITIISALAADAAAAFEVLTVVVRALSISGGLSPGLAAASRRAADAATTLHIRRIIGWSIAATNAAGAAKIWVIIIGLAADAAAAAIVLIVIGTAWRNPIAIEKVPGYQQDNRNDNQHNS